MLKIFMKSKFENDARSLLANVPDVQRQLHTNVSALRENLKNLARDVTHRVFSAYAPENQFSVSNMGAPMSSIVRSDLATEFAVTEVILRVLENSPEFKEADAIIAPLLLAVAQLEIWEQKEREDAGRRKAAFDSAREKARQRALENAENDPAVLAAKRDLETAQSSAK